MNKENKMSIVAFKLSLGYDVIAEVVNNDPALPFVTIKHPLGIAIREVPNPATNQPSLSVSLQEVLDFCENVERSEVKLGRTALVFEYEPSNLLVAEYKKITSGLILPPSAF